MTTTLTYEDEQAPIVAAGLVPALRNAAELVRVAALHGILVLGINSDVHDEKRVKVHICGRLIDEALHVALCAAVGLPERVDPVVSEVVTGGKHYDQETWTFGDVDLFYFNRRADLDEVMVPDCESIGA